MFATKRRQHLIVCGGLIVLLLSFSLLGCGSDNQQKTSSTKTSQSTQQNSTAQENSKKYDSQTPLSVEQLKELRGKEFKRFHVNNQEMSAPDKELLVSIIDAHIKEDDKPTIQQILDEANYEKKTDSKAPMSIHRLKVFRVFQKEAFQGKMQNAKPEEVELLQLGEEVMLSTVDAHIEADDKPTADQVMAEFHTAFEKRMLALQTVQRREYTRNQFIKIQEGMTYQQVAQILGNGGELFMESKNRQHYRWANSDFSNIVVEFESGRVTNAFQTGLR